MSEQLRNVTGRSVTATLLSLLFVRNYFVGRSRHVDERTLKSGGCVVLRGGIGGGRSLLAVRSRAGALEREVEELDASEFFIECFYFNHHCRGICTCVHR